MHVLGLDVRLLGEVQQAQHSGPWNGEAEAPHIFSQQRSVHGKRQRPACNLDAVQRGSAVVLGRLRSVRLEDREHTSSDCPVRRMHFIALNMHTLSPQHPAASRAAV